MLVKYTLTWGGDVLSTEVIDQESKGPGSIALENYYVEKLIKEKEIRNNADKTVRHEVGEL